MWELAEADARRPGRPVPSELQGTRLWRRTRTHGHGAMLSDFLSTQGVPGAQAGPTHLRCERASIAMVRTGDTRLSFGSALMIACRHRRALSCQAIQSARPGGTGALNSQ